MNTETNTHDALQVQFEALGRGESSNMAQTGPSPQKSRVQLEHELYSKKFVSTWNQGRDVAKLHTKYTNSNERDVRKMMDQHAAAYRRLSFTATADLGTQIFTTQAMEQAQKDLAADLQELGYFEDASSEGEPEYTTDEVEMLGRNISDWAVSDLEYARDSGLLDKLSGLEKVEFKLRAQQLAKTPSQLSQESRERKSIRYDVKRRKSNQGNTIARAAKLSNKPEHPAVTQLRHVDDLLYKLCKPRQIRKAEEHHESRDPVAVLGSVNVHLDNALQHSRSMGDVLPASFVDDEEYKGEEETLILLLQRIELQLGRIRKRVNVRNNAGEYKGYDEIALEVEEKFEQVRSALGV